MYDSNKYHKFAEAAQKLLKSDISLSEALKIARQHNPEAAKVLARHIYTDTLVPKVGNKFAYNDFLSRHRNSGVHISMDANSFGSINKEHGFEYGNEAIKQMFNTASEVSRQFSGKLFRVGGDEGRLYFPNEEKAVGFANEFKKKLAQNPKIAGKHQVSVAMGIGWSPEQAEKALISAKDQLGPLAEGKRQKIAPPGQEATVWHSLLHEPKSPNWRPATQSHSNKEGMGVETSGMKFKNPVE